MSKKYYPLPILLLVILLSTCSTPPIQQSISVHPCEKVIIERQKQFENIKSSPVIINEFCKTNISDFEFENKTFPAWIELKNTSESRASLEGYHIAITDTDGVTKKFTSFPEVLIEPGEFLLLVFTKEHTDSQTPIIHLIYDSPENIMEIELVHDELNLSDSFLYKTQESPDISKPQEHDFSLKRYSRCKQTLIKDYTPTPGLDNDTIIDSPIFDHSSGFYDELSLSFNMDSLPSGYEIRYTINDGIDQEVFKMINPDEWEYPTRLSGTLYEEPIPINSTSVVKARVYTPSGACSPISKRSYLIQEQSDLPVISLSTDPMNLWDPTMGIYTRGDGDVANFLTNNLREVSFEYFPDNQSKQPIIDDTYLMRIYGATSRWRYHKSLAIYAKEPGSLQRIPNEFFKGTAAEIQSLYSIVLRNSGGDNERTLIRDALITDLASNLNIDKQDIRHSKVFINGIYWGIYNIREKINEYYITDHKGVDLNEIDLIEGSYRVGMEAKEGDFEAIDKLIDFIEFSDSSDGEIYKMYKEFIDIENFIDYVIIEMFANNTDWPWSNVKMYRPRTESGRWRFILFDTDEGFDTVEYHTQHYEQNERNPHGIVSFDMLDYLMHSYNADIVSTLFRSLIVNEEFFQQFTDRYASLLTNELSTETIVDRIDFHREAIESEIENHLNRWTIENFQKDTMEEIKTPWLEQLDILYDFANKRPSEVSNHLANFMETYDPESYLGKIRNGAFEISDLSMWNLEYDPEKVFSTIIEEDGNHLGYAKILEGGNHPWEAVTFLYDSLYLVDGEELDISFDIKSAQPLLENQYVQISLFDCMTNENVVKKKIIPSPIWNHKIIPFTYHGPNIKTGRLVFMTGTLSAGEELFIDNISIN